MNNRFQTVSVIGLGYVGLPTACLLAHSGFQVLGCDNNQSVVDSINQGKAHIVVNELDDKLKQVVERGALHASVNVQAADVFIIAVPTPFKENKKPDLRYVEAAAEAIAPLLQTGNLVILESTSPIGTTEKLAEWINAHAKQVHVAHCPERVLPGHIMRELIENDRVIGGIDQASQFVAEQFYQQFVKGGILVTHARTAEMIKLAENAYRDVNIAFANELSMIADQVGVDVWEVIRLANRHPRVEILQPGPGVGGHCIAVDPWFIADAAPEQARLIKTARQVNDQKPWHVIQKISEAASTIENPSIACLGLSYKANIDDFRESPALFIVEQVAQKQLGKLLVVEPHLSQLPQCLLQHQLVTTADEQDATLLLCEQYTAIEQADIIVLLVNHRQFELIDPAHLADKILIDTRGMWT